MNRPVAKRICAVLALFLAVLMLLPVLLSVLPVAGAITQADLDRLKDEAGDLQREKAEIASELQQTRKDKESAMREKEILDQSIEVTERQIANTNAMIQELAAQIASKEEELLAAKQREADEYALFKRRIRAMEEAGDASYIGVMLKAESFSDLLSRFDVINDIMAHDRKVMEQLRVMREEIDDARQTLETAKSDQDAVKAELLAFQTELEESYQKQAAFVNQLAEQEKEYQRLYGEAEAAEKEAQKEIQSMMAELAKKNSVYVGGDFAWPINGYYNVTSPFGMRLHPVLKVNKMHTGVDIGAPQGASITAMNSGTVITAGYNNGYGNYVVIDHGGGRATLYAHMSKILVAKGQSVTKGGEIGKVGSTGYSTGPHLHFEVIIDGEQTNPMQYFQKQ
ncbi:peptidoglycan DD-metalloendopeptidase family protein [Oscillospiraceae bacterium OttesenSCG-928-F05]|nr:peptidoglycan DD-metalloendopeptidase family protein [Oscillospiraceae bacterium OttesenSCG-928-F05]